MKEYLTIRKQILIYLLITVILSLLPFCFLKHISSHEIQQIFSYRAEIKSSRIIKNMAYAFDMAEDFGDQIAFFIKIHFPKEIYDKKLTNNYIEKTKLYLSMIVTEAVFKNPTTTINACGAGVGFVSDEAPLIGRCCMYVYNDKNKGALIGRDLSDDNEYNYEKREWFFTPLKTKKPHWTKPYYGHLSDVMMITYSIPVIVKDKVVAVVFIDIPIDEFKDLIDYYNKEDNSLGYCFLMLNDYCGIGSKKMDFLADKSGIISFSSLKNRTNEFDSMNLDEYAEYIIKSRDMFGSIFSENSGIAFDEALVSFREKHQDMKKVMMDPVLKERAMYYFTPIANNSMIVLAIPENSMVHLITNMQKRFAFILLGIFILMIPFILILSKLASVQMMDLKNLADKFTGGDYDYRIPKRKYVPIISSLFGESYEMAVVTGSMNSLGSSLKKSFEEIETTKREIIKRLAIASEYRDSDTGKHIMRVGGYSESLAILAGLSSKEAEKIKEASTMHDVGKIGIPDSILLKQGRLDDNEYETMKKHTEIGGKILSGSESAILQAAEKIALSHHEKWDGSGYPSGLKGEDIPIEGRIVAICDVFDALTTERPYKKAWTLDKALDLIKSESGKGFDPKLVNLFIENKDIFIKIKEKIGN